MKKTANLNLILASGVALGAYVPPLLIFNQLIEKGKKAKFFVVENLIDDRKKNKILNNKYAFHRNFKVALTGQKLVEKSDYGISGEKVNKLYEEWDKLDPRVFSLFSGFWTKIVEDYIMSRRIIDYRVKLCHLDAGISTSWKNYAIKKIKFKNVWIFNNRKQEVAYHVKITKDSPVLFKYRSRRFVIHGGGWGIGTYRDKVLELKKHKIDLDIILYESDDIIEKVDCHRYFLIDPEWMTWNKYNGNYIFPPLKELIEDQCTDYDYSNRYPLIFDFIRNSMGIISKPGGATLIDSFSSSTPIIFLEPFGDYEKSNAELWKSLGFGIDLNTWLSMNCQTEILQKLHNNLLTALSKSEDLIRIYV